MSDGYWSEGTLYLCTENFTFDEVTILINAFHNKLNLVCSSKRRISSPSGKSGYRIRFSSKSGNIARLRKLVSPYMIPSMMYKLGL